MPRDSIPPSPGLRERILASTGAELPLEGFAERMSAFFDLPLERARELLEAASAPEHEGWSEIPVPGVKLYHLEGGPRVREADCGLVRLEPGVTFPHHRHLGDEWSLVLAGEAEEPDGTRLQPGDLVLRPSGSAHAYQALAEEPFVFAVVLHVGIETTGA